MNKIRMIILPLLILSSSLMFFTSCQPAVDELAGVNLDVPVFKSISATATFILKGTTTDVSAAVNAATSVKWSASDGVFADPTALNTTWTAPVLDDAKTIQLICTATNSAGSRTASISVKVVTQLLPDGATAYWSFDEGFDEEVNRFAYAAGDGDVSISSDAKLGKGAALLVGADMALHSLML